MSCLAWSLTRSRHPEILVGEQMACLFITLAGKAFLRTSRNDALVPPSDLSGICLSLEMFKGDRSCCHWLYWSLPVKHLMPPLIRQSTDGPSRALEGRGSPWGHAVMATFIVPAIPHAFLTPGAVELAALPRKVRWDALTLQFWFQTSSDLMRISLGFESI